MPNAEIELKFPVPSLDRLTAQLDALGFELESPRTFEANTLFDRPDRSLRERGELLRLRTYGTRHTLTHKCHPSNEALESRYKVRLETETTVADPEALAAIFAHIGLDAGFRYEKFRRVYRHPATTGVQVMIDETPIGIYAELEGPPEWIDRTVTALEVAPSLCMTESYGKLFLVWKKQTGSSAENLTFAEVGAATEAVSISR